MKKISAKQQQILEYISSYSLEHGYPPSVREIGAEMGLRSPSTVHAHLKKLQEALPWCRACRFWAASPPVCRSLR